MVSNNINKAFNQLDNMAMKKVEENSEKNSDIDTTDYHINVETPDLVIENDPQQKKQNINKKNHAQVSKITNDKTHNANQSNRRESDGQDLISPETNLNINKKKNRRSSDGDVSYISNEIKMLDIDATIKKTTSQRSLCESPHLSVRKNYLGDNRIFSNSNISVSSNLSKQMFKQLSKA